MKVSIVVPAFNEEERIAETLQGLIAQSYPNKEIIVVDNNSSDNTNSIAKKYTDRVISETEKGYIPAVNRGAKEADGELITFCDADTRYPAQWLSQIVETFQSCPKAVAVYGGADTYDANALSNWFNGVCYTSFLRLSRVLGLDNTSGFNFVMKREILLAVGGYIPEFKQISPDIELGKRVKKAGKIVFKPQIKASSSFRRYQDNGVVDTQWMFLKSWWSMLRGKAPNIDYETYNSR